MIRSIVWYVFFWVYLIGSLSFYIPLVVMRLFGLEKARKAFLAHQGGVWARAIVRVAGGRVTVVGKEHLPAHSSVCFVANHQGSLEASRTPQGLDVGFLHLILSPLS